MFAVEAASRVDRKYRGSDIERVRKAMEEFFLTMWG